ncbi:MAG: AMP-binding protein, partial [Puniceicoccales bacterium]
GTPPLFRALNQTHEPISLTPLRLCISAGARLDPRIAQDFFGKFQRKIHNFYGSSETGGIAYDPTGEATLRGEYLGLPIPGVTVNRTSSGNLLVSSPAVFSYGNRRVSNGIGSYRLSDKGTLGENQEVYLSDRHPSLLKIGGRRIITDELTRALRKHPEVSDFFITTVTIKGKDRLAAALEVRRAGLDTKTIRRQLAETISTSQLPRRIILQQQFPQTPRGKPDHRKLQEQLQS